MRNNQNKPNAANDNRNSQQIDRGNLVVKIPNGDGLTIGDSIIMYERHGNYAILKISAPKHIRIERIRMSPEYEW